MEYHSNHSKSGSKSEEGSTTLEEDMFLSIWYPSPPNFPKPYLHNQDFRDSNQALKYIKGEPSTPLLNIKVESPPTPTLQYPSSPTTPSSCYHSLGPNNFMVLVKNWNKVPRAIIAMLSDYTLWHRRMGHTHQHIIKHLGKKNTEGGPHKITDIPSGTCEACEKRKSKRLPFPALKSRVKQPLDLGHSNLD